MLFVKCEYERCNQIARYMLIWYVCSNKGIKLKTKNSCRSCMHLLYLSKTYKTAPDELLNLQTSKPLPNKLEEILAQRDQIYSK